jgi:type VI secretion system protein ImpE
MTAKELFDAGKLSEAIDRLNQDIKANPRDSRSRVFLFELLCFAGDFPRAERQLDAISQLSGDVNVEIGSQVYKNLLEAEKSRAAFFHKGGQPKFLFTPPSYATLHVEAIAELRESRTDRIDQLLEQSASSRPKVSGNVDGKPFAEFRDSDDLVAPFLEVALQKEYVWLPFENIKSIEIAAPKRLRDLIWISAKLENRDGPLGEVFLPVLYFGSSENPDETVKLGRMTDWKTAGEGTTLAAGQRIFLIDDTEYPMLEIRKIEFDISQDNPSASAS